MFQVMFWISLECIGVGASDWLLFTLDYMIRGCTVATGRCQGLLEALAVGPPFTQCYWAKGDGG